MSISIDKISIIMYHISKGLIAMINHIPFTCPSWNELPLLELYMDQVIIIIEESLSPMLPGIPKIITPTMINNYVKQKILPPTVKKKYNRKHLSELIMITLLKTVFNSEEIILILNTLRQHGTPMAAYNLFCSLLKCRLISEETYPNAANADPIVVSAISCLAGKMEFSHIIHSSPKEDTE